MVPEAIAEAEKAKAEWNPKANRAWHKRLRNSVILAARLAKDIRDLHPPPWNGDRRRIDKLIVELAGYAEGTLRATLPVERDTTLAATGELLRRLAQRISKKSGQIHWGLLSELSWLASGKKGNRPSERTVRRYLEIPIPEDPLPRKSARKGS